MLTRLVFDRAQLRDDDRGQTLVEYALLLALITLIVIVVLLLMGPAVSGVFQEVNDSIP
jgi:Flp pilus assembly pilin Flp